MKKTVKSLLIIICLLLSVSLASCNMVEEKVNEATAPLNETIKSLQSEIDELEGMLQAIGKENKTLEADKAALEAEKATLEAEKAALEKELAELKEEGNVDVEECYHVWIGEVDPEYTWADDFSSCTATFLCIECGEYVDEIASQIQEDENGNYIAHFNSVPNDFYVVSMPLISGVEFNSDSDGYDPDANTFTVSEENPFILTVLGENLSLVSSINDYNIEFLVEDEIWHSFDWIYDAAYSDAVIEDDRIVIQFNIDRLVDVLDEYGAICGLRLREYQTSSTVESSILEINLVLEGVESDSDFFTVTTAEELLDAFANYDKIKLGADIESVNGFDVIREVTLDLAGYDLKVTGAGQATFWVYQKMTVTNSAEEASSMYRQILTYADSTLIISGNVRIEDSYHVIVGEGFIDLTGYTGDELLIHTQSLSGLVISETYAFYETVNERRVDTYRTDEIYDIYVRPAATEVATAEELIAALENGGHILFTDNITVDTSIYTEKDVFINLGGYTLTLTNEKTLTVYSKNAVVNNGTIEAFGMNSALKTYADNLLVDRCILISEEYFALYCCDGVATVKNTVLQGGVNVSNTYTDTAIVYMVNNNSLNAGESYGVCVSNNGVLVLSFDPTDMLNEYYNNGIVTDNSDGTYTVKVEEQTV